jgi:hypothetical protein
MEVVDYRDVSSIKAVLASSHTLISVTSVTDGSQVQVETNLLKAAVQAGCVRFAPSQWGFGPKGWENMHHFRSIGQPIWEECVRYKGEIECAKFNMGAFMNYIGLGAVTNPSASDLTELESIQRLQEGGGYIAGEDEVVQGLQRQGDLEDGSGAFLLGMRNAIATLPCRDDGQLPRVTFTTVKDVGRFVAASLDLVKWEENMTMVGETVNLGDLLRHAEEITGFDFKVEIRSREADEERLRQLPPNDVLGQLFTQFRLAFGRDAQDEGILEPVVNRLCPDIKPMGIREYMEGCWRAAKAT